MLQLQPTLACCRAQVRVLSDIISCRDSFIAQLSKMLCPSGGQGTPTGPSGASPTTGTAAVSPLAPGFVWQELARYMPQQPGGGNTAGPGASTSQVRRYQCVYHTWAPQVYV